MFESIIIKIKQERFGRYSEAFNFFQSKSINMIIACRKMEYVVHFRDLEFLDDETEYFKRYYGTNETTSRLKKLINYYEINMTPPLPNLIPLHNYHLLETRNRKLLKLCIMKEKSQAKRSILHDHDDTQGQMILSQLNNSNYSAPSSDKSQDSQDESYDSQPYNTYEALEDESKDQGKSAINLTLAHHIEYMVLQFDHRQQPPAVNVPLPDKPASVSVAVQTMSVDTAPLKKPEKESKEREGKEKQRQKEKARQVPIPELKKEGSPLMNEALGLGLGLGLRSDLKKENVMLTESIEMVRGSKEEKKKPSTFMQYYNSIPVKQPSNILQKFIKRKK